MFKENKKVQESSVGNNKILTDTKIKGDIISKSDFRVDGEIEGNVSTSGRIVVGKTGFINGKVECQNADIEGKISGTIVVKNLLSLKSSAKIEGEVQTQKLAIEPGAIFNVTCSMKFDEPKK